MKPFNEHSNTDLHCIRSWQHIHYFSLIKKEVREMSVKHSVVKVSRHRSIRRKRNKSNKPIQIIVHGNQSFNLSVSRNLSKKVQDSNTTTASCKSVNSQRQCMSSKLTENQLVHENTKNCIYDHHKKKKTNR